jgi:hypothetical protein
VRRTIVQLREEQAEALAELAMERGVSISELVRQGVDRMLADANREEKIARFMSMAGSVSGPGDMGRRHDDYLVEAYSAVSDGTEPESSEV